MKLVLLLIAVLCVMCASAPVYADGPANGLANSKQFLTVVRSDLDSGLIDSEQALLLKFRYVFDRESLPPEYQVEDFSPLPCSTPLVSDYYARRDLLGTDTKTTIDLYLDIEPGRDFYVTGNGHFKLFYDLNGNNAVSAVDVNPANGIPDFIERIGVHLEYSWQILIEESGFAAPPTASGPMSVSFASLATYGYTTVVDAGAGTTRLVLHNSFVGFPPNDDPEGDVWGAAKVTVAHELKHSSQYVYSRWSEGDWIELDAVWAEELVYDQCNDYYNYLLGQNSIRVPTTPLDAGHDGTGSYEDCIFQLWLAETWGLDIVREFWVRRQGFTSESFLNSWNQMLVERGTSLEQQWSVFTGWNYAVGGRAVAGVGYSEGAQYAAGLSTHYTTTYPAVFASSIDHLAAEFITLANIGDTAGRVAVELDLLDAGPLAVTAVIRRPDGTGVLEILGTDITEKTTYLLSVDMSEILSVGLVVSNASSSVDDVSYTIEAKQIFSVPEPLTVLSAQSLHHQALPNSTTSRQIQLSNEGDVGSVLDYSVQLWRDNPADLDKVTTQPGAKNISGTSFTSNFDSYMPGTTITMVFAVVNGSSDDEWLTDITVNFPPGVTVNYWNSFVGGSLGQLIGTSSAGDGAQISWHGTYGTQEYGLIRDGETAMATVNVTFSQDLISDVQIPWTVSGDGFGGNPHAVNGTIVLQEDAPLFSVLSPNGSEVLPSDDDIFISWSAYEASSTLNVEISYDSGHEWQMVGEAISNTGFWEWELESVLSDECLVRITDRTTGFNDVSDATFTIYRPASWVSVSPEFGLLDVGQAANLNLEFDTDDLDLGSYIAYLVVDSAGASEATVVPVRLTVSDLTAAGDLPNHLAYLGSYPNPFNPKINIRFFLPQDSKLQLDILDLRGRLVRQVFQGELASGTREFVWDGRDDFGKTSAAGTYLIRLKAPGSTITAKVLLVK